MSVRARLDRLERALPAEPVDEGVVAIVCDEHPQCRGGADHPLGDLLTIRIRDYSVFEPAPDRSEIIKRLRAELAGRKPEHARTVDPETADVAGRKPGPTLHWN